MALVTNAVMTRRNFPFKGPEEMPDGIFSCFGSAAGDASGGSHKINVTFDSDVPADPVSTMDVLYRLDILIATSKGAITNGLRVQLKQDHLWSQTQLNDIDLLYEAVFTSRVSFRENYQRGIFTWTQKEPQKGGIFLFSEVDNVDTAVHTIFVQGVYWYVGPRRLARMARPL